MFSSIWYISLLWLFPIVPAAYVALIRTFLILMFLVGVFNDQELVVKAPWLQAGLRYGLAPLYGFKPVDATTTGYTTLIYGTDSPDLRVHEAYHRFQAEREGPRWLPRIPRRLVGAAVYGIRYSLEYMRHGYYANRYEREARVAAGQEPEAT